MERNEVLEAQARQLMTKYGKGSVQQGKNGKKPCIQFFFDDVDGKKKRKSINIPEGKTADNVKLEFFVELLKKYGEQGGFDFEDASSDKQILTTITALKAMDERGLKFVLESLDNVKFSIKGSCKKTFKEVSEEFLEECERNGVSYSSRENYSNRIKSINRYIGDVMVRDIDKETAQNMLYSIRRLDSGQYCKAIVVNIKRLFNCIMQFAEDKGYIENCSDVIKGLKIPINLKECDSEDKFYKIDEAARILQKLDGHDLYYTVMTIACCTAMRREEILGLRKEDIDFDRKRIYVRQAVIKADKNNNNKCRYKLGLTKTKSSVRCVPMNELAKDAILRWMDVADRKHRYEKAVKHGNNSLLFVDKNGMVVLPDSVTSGINKYLERRSVESGEGKLIHVMRHTCTNYIRRMGLDEVAVKQIGGWTNKAGGTFEKHYLKLYEEDELIELALPYVEKYGKMVFNYMVVAGTGIPVEELEKFDWDSLENF